MKKLLFKYAYENVSKSKFDELGYFVENEKYLVTLIQNLGGMNFVRKFDIGVSDFKKYSRKQKIKNYMKTIKDFLDKGICQNKIIEINCPCVTWSLSKRRIVGNTDFLELVTENGETRLTTENNRKIIVNSYSDLTTELINQINSSEGILVYLKDFDGKGFEEFRFNFIPVKEEKLDIPDYSTQKDIL